MALNNHLSKFKPKNSKKIKVKDSMIMHLSEEKLSPERKKEILECSKESKRQNIASAIIKSLDRLFPDREDNSKVTQADIKALRSRFKGKVEKLDKDRNNNRAHQYEKDQRKNNKKTLMLSFTEIECVFNLIEEILNDLRMITEVSVFEFDIDMGRDTRRTSQDVVDLIVFGSISNAAKAREVSK